MSLKHSERYKNIGIKISKYRNKKNLTQEQLANKVGMSYSYLTQIEAPNVVKKMSLEVLFDIVDELKIDNIDKTIADVQKEADKLKEQGVNKIILLSHVGFGYDQRIAKETDGIDIILETPGGLAEVVEDL